MQQLPQVKLLVPYRLRVAGRSTMSHHNLQPRKQPRLMPPSPTRWTSTPSINLTASSQYARGAINCCAWSSSWRQLTYKRTELLTAIFVVFKHIQACAGRRQQHCITSLRLCISRSDGVGQSRGKYNSCCSTDSLSN